MLKYCKKKIPSLIIQFVFFFDLYHSITSVLVVLYHSS